MNAIRLNAYENVERTMMELDDAKDPLADVLRDTLDNLWLCLTENERAVLNGRGALPSARPRR
jgi:hypothetical protein